MVQQTKRTAMLKPNKLIKHKKIAGRGALIVIEGVDRSGKSTQCRKLVESLVAKNIKAELISFPDRTTLTGKLINDYLTNPDVKLNDRAVHLLFSANRWENVDKMKTLLYSGTTLIVDRYCYSGIAFSMAKGNINLDWCKQPENGLPKPDLVFLLTLHLEEAARRSGFGDERYENPIMQTKVSMLFEQLSQEDDNWMVVDAGTTVDNLHTSLLNAVLEKITEVSQEGLKTLQFVH